MPCCFKQDKLDSASEPAGLPDGGGGIWWLAVI
jgi:hypothetical protein